jgi:type I restriction enzyme, S subunit
MIIPKDWKKIKLGKIGKFTSSSVNKKTNHDEPTVSLLNYMDVYNNSLITNNHRFQLVTAPKKQIVTASVENGDVLFTPSSETPHDIGHSAVFKGKLSNLVHSYHTIRFRVNSKEFLDDSYKAYAFKSNETFKYFRRRATGSTRFTLSLPVFNDLEIILPPLKEQRKIASILISVDELIACIKEKIIKLENLKLATSKKLLTKGIGHKEFKDSKLGKIPKNWQVKKLKEVGQCIRGLTYSPENVVEKGMLVLRSSNIKNGSISLDDNVYVNLNIEEKFNTKIGDILICVRNGSRNLIGKSARISKDMKLTTHGAFMTVFRTNLNQYVQFLLKSESFFTQVSRDIGATINSINNKNLLDYIFAFPPLEEQTMIVNHLNSIQNLIDETSSKLIQIQSLKKSLLQNLLNGKLRVKIN